MKKFKKLDPEFKAKWVAALRSGDYKQTTLKLHRASGGYCCLGVVGILCGLNSELLLEKDAFCESENLGGLLNKIPKQLLGAGNVEEKDYNPLIEKLACMNDGHHEDDFNPTGKKYTFLEIADWIEENL